MAEEKSIKISGATVTQDDTGNFSISGIFAPGLEKDDTVSGELEITKPEGTQEGPKPEEGSKPETQEVSNTNGGKKGGKKNTRQSKKNKKGGKSRKNKKSGSKKRR